MVKREIRRFDWGAWPVRFALAAILGVAAFTKIKDPAEVIATMDRSGLFPTAWDEASAYAVIAFEIVLALAVLPRKTAQLELAGYAAFSSLLFGYSLWRGWQDIKAPCGCFGLLLRLLPWHGALLSSLMCVAALLALQSLSPTHSIPHKEQIQLPIGEPT